jgi:hypothetical protein
VSVLFVCSLLAKLLPSARAHLSRRRTRLCTPPHKAVHAAAQGSARREPRAAEAGGARAQELRVSWAFQKDKAEDTATHFHIFVGNLSGNVTDPALLEAFKAAGSCSDARVMWDHATGRSKGYGFVSFRRGRPARPCPCAAGHTRPDLKTGPVPDEPRRTAACVLFADVAWRGQ